MATLSGYTITTETMPKADAGRRLDIAEGGQIRGRNTFEQTVYSIQVVIITDTTGVSSLNTFYSTYSDSWNEFTIDGTTYTWLFATKPMVVEKDGPIRKVAFDVVGNEA